MRPPVKHSANTPSVLKLSTILQTVQTTQEARTTIPMFIHPMHSRSCTCEELQLDNVRQLDTANCLQQRSKCTHAQLCCCPKPCHIGSYQCMCGSPDEPGNELCWRNTRAVCLPVTACTEELAEPGVVVLHLCREYQAGHTDAFAESHKQQHQTEETVEPAVKYSVQNSQ